MVRILTYGYESWVMTERVRLQMQASEIRLLRKIEGITMFDKLHNSAIQESLNTESLFLRIKKSQLRWFGYASRMSRERLFKQTLYAEVNGKRRVR